MMAVPEDTQARLRSEELDWIVGQCSLAHDPDQLQIHYGAEALRMMEAFRAVGREHVLPLLSCPGIATRWRLLLEWLETWPDPIDLPAVFSAFAEHLGRVTTYRALALTEAEFQKIREVDSIRASGRLKTDANTLVDYVRREGIRKVLDIRMRRIGDFPYDPSLSLHDHPETAVCVAEGYIRPPNRLIYRFELDLPVIEIIGWSMSEVNGDRAWFIHRGIWFDPTNPRTERFALYEIPFFAARCKSIRIFGSLGEVADYLLPFAEEQGCRRRQSLAAAHPDSP